MSRWLRSSRLLAMSMALYIISMPPYPTSFLTEIALRNSILTVQLGVPAYQSQNSNSQHRMDTEVRLISRYADRDPEFNYILSKVIPIQMITSLRPKPLSRSENASFHSIPGRLIGRLAIQVAVDGPRICPLFSNWCACRSYRTACIHLLYFRISVTVSAEASTSSNSMSLSVT